MSPEEITYGLEVIVEYALTDPVEGTKKPPTWGYPQWVLADVQRRMARNRRLEEEKGQRVCADYLTPVYEMLLAVSEELDNTHQAVSLSWERAQREEHGDPNRSHCANRSWLQSVAHLTEAQEAAEQASLLMQQALGQYARVVQLAAAWEQGQRIPPLRADMSVEGRRNYQVQAELKVRINDRPMNWALPLVGETTQKTERSGNDSDASET